MTVDVYTCTRYWHRWRREFHLRPSALWTRLSSPVRELYNEEVIKSLNNIVVTICEVTIYEYASFLKRTLAHSTFLDYVLDLRICLVYFICLVIIFIS